MSNTQLRAAVRGAGRMARQNLVGGERVSAERLIVAHLRSLDVLRRASVGVFVAHDGEPDLTPLVEWLWSRGSEVALPCLVDDPEDRTMRFLPWHRDDTLQPGRFDIPVPPPRPAMDPDVLLVSLVGFDALGNRMGRGAGFFDRYLARSSAEVVGVGFEAQRFAEVPTEPHDVALPVVVTELGVRFVTKPGQYPPRSAPIGKDGRRCE